MVGSTPMRLSIIIPVYNEQDTIGQVIEEVKKVHIEGVEKEIIVSNDGSTDDTASVITNHDYDGRLKIHTSPINLGKGAAVRLGLSYATGDVIIVQDADLELNPQEYHKLLAPIINGEHDVVYGSRFLHQSDTIPRRSRLANRVLTWLTNVLFAGQLSDMETAYKVFRRETIIDIRLRCVRFDFEPEITAHFLKAGYEIREVPISYSPRTDEEGKKISVVDGIEAIYTLLRCRFQK